MAITTLNDYTIRLTKLAESLKKDLSAIKSSQTFLEKYQKLPKYQINDSQLSVDHVGIDYASRITISNICNGHLENLKKEFEEVKAGLSASEKIEGPDTTLNRVFEQIEEYSKSTEVFKKTIIKDLQQGAPFLLNDGCLFGASLTANYNGVISECHCSELMKRSNRAQFSSSLVRSVVDNWPNKKEITIAGIGAGGCFHELEIHTLMVQRGYKPNWILVDPNLMPKTASAFKDMAQWTYPEVTVATFSSTANKYFATFANQATTIALPEVFLFIDVDIPISSQEIQSYQLNIKHPCLFANFNKYQGADAWEAIIIDEVNIPNKS